LLKNDDLVFVKKKDQRLLLQKWVLHSFLFLIYF
jgi:hypothetical protein